MNLFQTKKASQPDAESKDVIDTDNAIVEGLHVQSMGDEEYMSRALWLAKKGEYTCHPNPAVGCVIVKNGEIVGEGWHHTAGQAHAEINALKAAGNKAKGATMYVTLEPCCHQGKTPPCTRAIMKSGIERVVVATEDPNPLVNRAGISELKNAGITVVSGIGQAQAKFINREFFKRVTTGIPWVTLKIATSLDGKTAMQSGESQWITSEPARLDSHKLRAAASAVLTGVGTILRDDPSMTARLPDITRQPDRVILDTNMSTPSSAKIFQVEGNVVILTSTFDDDYSSNYDKKKTEIIECPIAKGRIDLHEVMTMLGSKEYNSILIEAGAKLSGAVIQAGLVDEIILYMSADVLGSDARDMFSISGLENLSDRIKFEFQSTEMIGKDIRIALTPVSDSV